MNKHTTNVIQSEEEDIKCNFRESSFLSDADLRLHLAAHHTKVNYDTLAHKTLAQELLEIGELPLLQNHPEITQISHQDNTTGKIDEDPKTHMTIEHSTPTPYQCDKCPFTTAEEVVFNHHTLMMHVPGFECLECKKIIFPDDNVICCSNCDFFFHKHCTTLNLVAVVEPNTDWCCHLCLPQSSEDQVPQSVRCHLCQFEAGNKSSLDAHLLNNHCPDIAAQCDFCDKRFPFSDTLLIRIQNHHAPELVLPQSQEDLNSHSHDTFLKLCLECTKEIKDSDRHTVTCSKCLACYHKKCTELKSATGRSWRPNTWHCKTCRSSPDVQSTNDTEKDTSELVVIENPSNKLPNFTGKQRKSNVETNPQIEFYIAQITSLKVALAQKDTELKKVVESDRLKAQKIMTLNAEIQEHRNNMFIPNTTSTNDEPTTIVITSDNNFKVHILELKATNLEQQLSKLESKVESLQINITTRSDYRHVCNESQPTSFPCKKCDFETSKKHELKEHYRTTHPQKQFQCDGCDFTSVHNNQLQKHIRTTHATHRFQCDQCSYIGIHEKDLDRHINTMHNDEPFYCDKCDFETMNENTIIKHVNEVHKHEQQTRTFFSNTRKRPTATGAHSGTRSKSPTIQNKTQPQRNLFCNLCDKTFNVKDHFDLHNAYYHGSSQ